MKISSATLRAAIEGPVTLASKRTTLPALNHLKIGSTDGRLVISASNIDVYQEVAIACEGDLEPVCMPAGQLAQLLAGFKDGEAVIESDGNKIKVAVGRDSAKLSVLPATEFIERPNIEGDLVTLPAAELADAMRSVAWCISTEISRDEIHGICVRGSDVCATDGRKVSLATLSVGIDSSMFIPTYGVSYLREALLQDSAELVRNERQLIVQHPGGFVAVKRAEKEAFVSYEPVFNMEFKHIGTVDSRSFTQSIRLAASLYDDVFAHTRLEFSASGCVISQNSGKNELHSEFAGEFADLKFACNAQWILKALSSLGETVEIHGKDSLAPLMLKSGNVKVIIMGLRW